MRQITVIIVAIGLVLLSIFGYNTMIASKKEAPKVIKKEIKTVFTKPVSNKTIPILVVENGLLQAKHRLEIYSEVQGVLQGVGKDFREGVTFTKGQTLLKLNSAEYYASIQAQRSTLQNLIASIMPDLRLDYPEAFAQWDTYLKSYSVNKTIAKLPNPTSDKEKYFVSGRNIYATYYTIKNMETRLSKFNIKAPYSGIVTQALVTRGTLVRAGQKMGEYIDTSVYELALAVNASYANVLKVGKAVQLENKDHTEKWEGKVTRINGKIDQASQSLTIYIEVKGKYLREGMYLEASVPIQEAKESIEISRTLLVDNTYVYLVEEDLLVKYKVTPVHFNENTVIVQGLKNGQSIVSRPVPGAYEGMKVSIYKEQ